MRISDWFQHPDPLRENNAETAEDKIMGPSAGWDVQGLGRAWTSLVRGLAVLLEGLPHHPVDAPISSWRRLNPPARCDASLFRRVFRAGGKAEHGLSQKP